MLTKDELKFVTDMRVASDVYHPFTKVEIDKLIAIIDGLEIEIYNLTTECDAARNELKGVLKARNPDSLVTAKGVVVRPGPSVDVPSELGRDDDAPRRDAMRESLKQADAEDTELVDYPAELRNTVLAAIVGTPPIEVREASETPKVRQRDDDFLYDDGGYNPADVSDSDYFRELFGGEDFSSDGPSLAELDAPALTKFELAALREFANAEQAPNKEPGIKHLWEVFPGKKGSNVQKRAALKRAYKKGYLDQREHDYYLYKVSYAGELALRELGGAE